MDKEKKSIFILLKMGRNGKRKLGAQEISQNRTQQSDINQTGREKHIQIQY